MNFGEIKKRVASYINRLDTNDNIVSREVSVNDIENFINDRYVEEIFPAYSNIKPEFFIQKSTAPTYQVTGIISSVATDQLTTTDNIFANDMIGAKVYNIDKDETVKIVGYTNSTTVTMMSDISDWEALDVIYVITGTYILAGDLAPDYSKSNWVGIKYTWNDDNYTWCEAVLETDERMFRFDDGLARDEEFSQVKPYCFFTTVDVGGSPQSAITIRPIPDSSSFIDGDGELVEDREGVMVKYVEIPKRMTNDSDEPRLPKGHHKILVYGAVADCMRKMEKFSEAAIYDTVNPSLGVAWKGTGLYNTAFRALMKSQNTERKRTFINIRPNANNTKFINFNTNG